MSDIKLNIEPNQNGELTFRPGDIIKGNVTLTLSKPKNIREFFIRIHGEAKATWSSSCLNTTTHYTGSEPLIDSKISLIGSFRGPKFILQRGVYKYQYSYKLPDNIPSSLFVHGRFLSSKFGTIEYHVEAVLEKFWTSIEKVDFKVLRNDNLNHYPELMMPLTFIDKTKFGMKVSIPYSGYTVNQHIPITIDYENDSTINIRNTSIKFIQTISLVLPREINPIVKTMRKVIYEGSTDGVRAKSSKTLTASMTVPDVLKSNYRFCSVVSVSYYIEVTANVNSIFQRNRTVIIPITIGDIPLNFSCQTGFNNMQ